MHTLGCLVFKHHNFPQTSPPAMGVNHHCNLLVRIRHNNAFIWMRTTAVWRWKARGWLLKGLNNLWQTGIGSVGQEDSRPPLQNHIVKSHCAGYLLSASHKLVTSGKRRLVWGNAYTRLACRQVYSGVLSWLMIDAGCLRPLWVLSLLGSMKSQASRSRTVNSTPPWLLLKFLS